MLIDEQVEETNEASNEETEGSTTSEEELEAIAQPIGDIAIDSRGNVYIAIPHKILRIDPRGGEPIIIAGGDDPGYLGDGGHSEAALLDCPCSLAIRDDKIFILDSGNKALRAIDRNGIITTLANL